jgi:hypothetical protein
MPRIYIAGRHEDPEPKLLISGTSTLPHRYLRIRSGNSRVRRLRLNRWTEFLMIRFTGRFILFLGIALVITMLVLPVLAGTDGSRQDLSQFVAAEDQLAYLVPLSDSTAVIRDTGNGPVYTADRSGERIRIFPESSAGSWTGMVGVFRQATHRFLLKNGSATTTVNWGASTDLPVSGDWNGDGFADVGVFRPLTHRFLLKNGSETTIVNWGTGADLPVTGDWNGDGLSDMGVFRNSTHMFYLKNGTANTSVNWGLAGDKPVTGKWS